jgi:hypothetical protein
MSHHFDTKLAKEDPSLNLCDFYLFEGVPGNTVMAMTVNPDSVCPLQTRFTLKASTPSASAYLMRLHCVIIEIPEGSWGAWWSDS